MPNDIALSRKAAPARGPGDRSQPGEISPKIRAVLERMIEFGESWDIAARTLGISARSMRRQLERPVVLSLLRRRRQVAREAASAGNIKRLVELRDQSTNLMASCKAIQLLDAGDEPQRRHDTIVSPGLVVIVEGAKPRVEQPKPVTIEHEPQRELDRGDDGAEEEPSPHKP
jgi:hypothetical protein